MFPSNEAETIELFQFLEPWLGWEIAYLQRKFPDAIIANSHGAELVAEFEFLSANYRIHGHPDEGCDLIICFRDNWPDAPVPVWALEETILPERKNVPRLEQKLINAYENIWNLHCEVESLEQKVEQLEQDLEIARGAYNHCFSNRITWQGRNKLDDIIWYSEDWKHRAKMKQFLAYALSLEPVQAYLDMMYCGGGIAPRGTETRKAIEGRANDSKWDYWDGWEAARF